MYDLHTSIDGAKFPGELVPINQFQSLPTLMPVLGSGSSAQPFATAADYDRFLKRMRDYIVWSDQAIANMREGLAQKLTYPRILMEKVLPQLQDVIVADPQTSLFYAAAQEFPGRGRRRPTAPGCRPRTATRSRRRSIRPTSGCTTSSATSTCKARARKWAGRQCRTAREWYAYLAKSLDDDRPDAGRRSTSSA